MTQYDKYFELQKNYQSKYGEEVVLLKKNGFYYEIYEENFSEYLIILCNIFGFGVFKRKDIYSCGFPDLIKDKYIKILLEHGYYVVILG